MRWLAVVIVLATSTAAASPRATDADARARLDAALVEIRAHVHALRYAEARAAAEAALAIGAADPARLAELARTLAEVAAALDDAPTAERWFVEWLTIDPRAELPPGTSPKLTEPLAAARSHGAGLSIARVDVTADGAHVDAVGDPGAVVTGAVVIVTDGRGVRTSIAVTPTRLADAPGRLAIELARADVAAIDVSLRDAHGNEVLATTASRRDGTGDHAGPRPRSRSLFARPWPYVAASVVTAGLGAVFLWRRAVARDELDAILVDSANHTFAEAEAARDRAERYGWLSVASFAVAGAFAATAVVLGTRGNEVVVTPVAGGATVVTRLRF